MNQNDVSPPNPIYDPINKIDAELENDIIKYLKQKIQSNNFNIKDLSYVSLLEIFNMNSDSNKKRLKLLLKRMEGEKLLKRKSGIEIYIPIEVKDHANVKEIKPISYNDLTIQFFIGFSFLILVTQIPILGPYIGNLLIGLYLNQSIIPMLALSVGIGFFLPLSIGYAIRKAYLYILPFKFITYLLIAIGLCELIYVFLIYGLNLFYKTTNYMVDPIGVLTAIGIGIAIVALPTISKRIQWKDDEIVKRR